MHIIYPQQLLNKNKNPITTRVTELQEINLLILSVKEGSLTTDIQLRKQSIYPAKLLRHYIGLIKQKPPRGVFICSVLGGIRTPDRWLRRPLLYPAELPGLNSDIYNYNQFQRPKSNLF